MDHPKDRSRISRRVKVMIRPERIVIEPHGSAGEDRLPGMIERSVFVGGSHELPVRVLAASC